jgi:hypothetical protein
MDDGIEAFVKDVLALEGQNSNVVRESVRHHLAVCEAQFRDAEPDARKKGAAAERFRRLSRDRVIEEIQQRSAISTIGQPLQRTARGHHFDFTSRACTICGMTHQNFLNKGRPACMGPEKPKQSKIKDEGPDRA